MQQKNIFLMLALSGSVLMVMLVSTLLFIPKTASLQADIAFDSAPEQEVIRESMNQVHIERDPEEIMKTIQKYVENNDSDTAKKLYEELYNVRRFQELKQMGGEVLSGNQ